MIIFTNFIVEKKAEIRMDSFRLHNEDDSIVARVFSTVAPLEYLKSKQHLTRFDPNEELIFFPELYGICPVTRHRDCLKLKNAPELRKFVENFVKRTTKPGKRSPIFKYIHEYNFVEIYLTDSRLKNNRVPEQIFQCINLRVLCLNGNFLHSLSPSVGRLRKLEVLLLSDNCLQTSSLPHTLSFCHNLRTLHLDNNLIITLPGFLLKMTNLRTLRRLSTKITVRDILRKTTAKRSIECFRIEKKARCSCKNDRINVHDVPSLELLAKRKIILMKIDYLKSECLPQRIQAEITKMYKKYQPYICDNCDDPVTDKNFGYEVNTHRFGHLGNNWSVFVMQACSRSCAEKLDRNLFEIELRTKNEMSRRYKQHVNNYKNEFATREEHGEALKQCCVIL